MKMLKTYWLELLFFALGLVGAAFAFPFLPGSIPRQWNNGQVVATMPKAVLFLIPVVLLLGLCHKIGAGGKLRPGPSLSSYAHRFAPCDNVRLIIPGPEKEIKRGR